MVGLIVDCCCLIAFNACSLACSREGGLDGTLDDSRDSLPNAGIAKLLLAAVIDIFGIGIAMAAVGVMMLLPFGLLLLLPLTAVSNEWARDG